MAQSGVCQKDVALERKQFESVRLVCIRHLRWSMGFGPVNCKIEKFGDDRCRAFQRDRAFRCLSRHNVRMDFGEGLGSVESSPRAWKLKENARAWFNNMVCLGVLSCAVC